MESAINKMMVNTTEQMVPGMEEICKPEYLEARRKRPRPTPIGYTKEDEERDNEIASKIFALNRQMK